MNVRELMEQLAKLEPDLPVLVWMPGTRIELSAPTKVFDHPTGEFVCLIEGNVQEVSPTGRMAPRREPNIQNVPGSLADDLDKLHERGVINLDKGRT